MESRLGFPAEASRIGVRRASFEDVPALLRLIEGAIARGCRDHYSVEQRRAVFLTYAESLFVDVVQPLHTLVVEAEGRPLGMAQLDPAQARLRALFVGGELQGQGLGHGLLECVERLARKAGLPRIDGAMSLNAVPFYTRAGFKRTAGSDRLIRSGVVVPVVPMGKALPTAGPTAPPALV